MIDAWFEVLENTGYKDESLQEYGDFCCAIIGLYSVGSYLADQGETLEGDRPMATLIVIDADAHINGDGTPCKYVYAAQADGFFLADALILAAEVVRLLSDVETLAEIKQTLSENYRTEQPDFIAELYR